MREMRQLPGLLKQEREGLATLLNILFNLLVIEHGQRRSSSHVLPPSSSVGSPTSRPSSQVLLDHREFLMMVCRYVNKIL